MKGEARKSKSVRRAVERAHPPAAILVGKLVIANGGLELSPNGKGKFWPVGPEKLQDPIPVASLVADGRRYMISDLCQSPVSGHHWEFRYEAER